MNEIFGKSGVTAYRADMSGGNFAVQNEPENKLPVLIIVHQMQSNPGIIGQWFRQNGHPVDIRRPRFGDPLPESLDGYCGAVVFGGPMSANDKDTFIKKEIDWISVPLREKKPFLGVCLGAQMLVKHLGGEVGPHPGSMFECGYYPITPTDDGRQFVDWPDYVYQWHGEGFTLTDGCKLLAGGDIFQNQAIVYGDQAFGVQFHPEITLAMVHRWTVMGARRIGLPGTKSRDVHFPDHRKYAPEVRAWVDQFLRNWLETVG